MQVSECTLRHSCKYLCVFVSVHPHRFFHVSMCVYTQSYIHAVICVFVWVHTHRFTQLPMYVHNQTFMQVSVYVCVHEHLDIHAGIYVFVCCTLTESCMYLCMFVCVYTHTFMQISLCVCVYTLTHSCMYLCVHTHTLRQVSLCAHSHIDAHAREMNWFYDFFISSVFKEIFRLMSLCCLE